MYINITDSDKGDNKGSSGQLVHYLDKENRLFDLPKPEEWFNGTDNSVPSYEVSKSIDNNIAKLSRDDAKFFLINISPSQKEITYLKERYGEETAREKLKEYAVKVMDEYAKNFNRPGIESNKDLLWFAKLENNRYYTHKDKEVKDGTVIRGTVKPGEQMHIQVIVSRKDITNKIKLSPMNNSRGRNAEHSKKLGQFDRSAFKASGERLFDEKFDFDRGLADTYRYANAQKNGSLEERMALHAEQGKQQPTTKRRTQSRLAGKGKALEQKQTYLTPPAPAKFMEIALGKTKGDQAPLIPRKKKRKKKPGQQQDQGLSI
jgi:hypothetical protein